MRVRFELTMEELVVSDEVIDQFTIEWEDDFDRAEILELSHIWITSRFFLTKRMLGLQKVGQSSLCIEPLDEGIQDFSIL